VSIDIIIFKRFNPELFTERKTAALENNTYTHDLILDVYDWIILTNFRIGYLKLHHNAAIIKFLDRGDATLFKMAFNI
jgi:hypothetical protein